MSLTDAATQVHSKRRQAYPNIGFIQNLTDLDRELRHIKSKSQSPAVTL